MYDPLVVTKGTTPAVAPVVPKLPRHAVVTIDIGFNGAILRQVGATRGALRQGNCTDGEPGSPFGQVSFCNGTNFFKAAFAMERRGQARHPVRRDLQEDGRVRRRAGHRPGLPDRA